MGTWWGIHVRSSAADVPHHSLGGRRRGGKRRSGRRARAPRRNSKTSRCRSVISDLTFMAAPGMTGQSHELQRIFKEIVFGTFWELLCPRTMHKCLYFFMVSFLPSLSHSRSHGLGCLELSRRCGRTGRVC